jgi:exonuclease SbcD
MFNSRVYNEAEGQIALPQDGSPMMILHTSDWHLGRTLCGRRRHDEFASFLDWLAETLALRRVEVLLISGDIFDTGSPGSRAQELYYNFLRRASEIPACAHVVIIAGNHDSPSFLSAPGALLKTMNIHVVGSLEDPHEVMLLKRGDGRPGLIVCAVPFPREREVREAREGESAEDKEKKMAEGIRRHYEQAAGLARRMRAEAPARPGGGETPPHLPIVAMGHLFAAGGRTVEGDGVRDLSVGSLAHVPADIFSPVFDYVALGHLHLPQTVGSDRRIRYSGAPLAMGFGEAGGGKSVCLLELTPSGLETELVDVPVFQRLESVKGDWEAIGARLQRLKDEGAKAWLEIEYTGPQIIGDLRGRLDEAVAGAGLEILRVRNKTMADRALSSAEGAPESLDEMDYMDVFARCLEAHEVPEEDRPELLGAYREIVSDLLEGDGQADGSSQV